MGKSIPLLFLFLFFQFVCQSAWARSNDETQIPGEAQALWDSYVFNTVATRTLQAGCEPVQMKPASGVPYRGVVILLHGFSSCPKQYWGMSRHLNELGYHVLIPLLPGHGGAADNELDAQTFLPGASNWFNYDAFARWVNELARGVAQGEIHLGGFCLGGTVAMRAMQLEPTLYQSSMLFSPFFDVSVRLLGRLGLLLGRVNDVLNVKNAFELPVSLVDENICVGIERNQLGRAGYCRMRLKHLIGVERFAQFVRSKMKPLQTRLQTIIVENDPVAHPQVNLSLLENFTQLGHGRNSVCIMNASASHSFFSTTDLPMPKPWLKELHLQLGEFLTEEKALVTSDSSRLRWPVSGAAVSSCALWP